MGVDPSVVPSGQQSARFALFGWCIYIYNIRRYIHIIPHAPPTSMSLGTGLRGASLKSLMLVMMKLLLIDPVSMPWSCVVVVVLCQSVLRCCPSNFDHGACWIDSLAERSRSSYAPPSIGRTHTRGPTTHSHPTPTTPRHHPSIQSTHTPDACARMHLRWGCCWNRGPDWARTRRRLWMRYARLSDRGNARVSERCACVRGV